MKAPRIMIAATKSGSGKTLLTCALLEALKRRGMKPSAFKCGPDYIDPMFHKEVLGVPSRNLDLYMASEEQALSIFLKNHAEISIVEGVMGLYDGLGGILEEGSSYHLACALKLPIVLVVDAYGMGRSLLSLLAGFMQHDREHRICGVILNRISKGFYETIAPVIEQELTLSVFGYYPTQKELHLESRHLGLWLPEEIKGLRMQTEKAAAVFEETICLDALMKAAQAAPSLEWVEKIPKKEVERVRIGIARDEAFCFYYEENLDLLKDMGAELIPFSPMYDKELPENLHGLLFGGGYPELHGDKLSANLSMRQSVKAAMEHGMPSIAECGGFLYLHEKVKDAKGQAYDMCGLVRGNGYPTGRPVRFGYLSLTEKSHWFLNAGESIRGHEFHYYDSEKNGDGCIAQKPVSEKTWECIHESENHWWGFPHLYYPSNIRYPQHFIREALKYKNAGNVLKRL